MCPQKPGIEESETSERDDRRQEGNPAVQTSVTPLQNSGQRVEVPGRPDLDQVGDRTQANGPGGAPLIGKKPQNAGGSGATRIRAGEQRGNAPTSAESNDLA